MNNPILMEMLANEVINRRRREGLMSQELAREGVGTPVDFGWIERLLVRAFLGVTGVFFPGTIRIRLSKVQNRPDPC